MTAQHRRLTRIPAVALALFVAACATAAGPTSPGPSPTPPASGPGTPADPTPVPVPGTPDGGGAPGGGGGSGGGSGGGTVPGNPGDPGAGGGGGGDDPGIPDDSQATIVTPVPGLVGIRDVGATSLRVAVDGRHVTAKVAWWSGVEPCSVLAGVLMVRDGTTITLTVREGSGAQGVACIEIAMFKATIVDLGELDPGTWTIRAYGDAAPVEVTIAG
jgi:hypothetical protein